MSFFNWSGRQTKLGSGAGAGVLFCGVRFTGPGQCKCGNCDGKCGPADGCACSECDGVLAAMTRSADIRCSRGHVTQRKTLGELRAEPGGALYRSGFTCDGPCRRLHTSAFEPVIHCGRDGCEWDMCAACAWERIPDSLKRSASIDPATSTIRCPQGHVLTLMTVASLAEMWPALYRTGFFCDRCKVPWTSGLRYRTERVFHCHSCNPTFDLCISCATSALEPVAAATTSVVLRCSRGHDLIPVTVAALMATVPGYQTGFTCDTCSARWQAPRPTSETVRHCYSCQYDVCARCVAEMAPPALSLPSIPGAHATAHAPAPPAVSPTTETDECIVCYAAEREVLFTPCSHFICCRECSDKVSMCPKCRSPISTRVRVFK